MRLKEKFEELQTQYKVARTDCQYATFVPVVGGVEVRKDTITMTWDELVRRYHHRVANDLPVNPVEKDALKRINNYRERSPSYSTLEKLGIRF